MSDKNKVRRKLVNRYRFIAGCVTFLCILMIIYCVYLLVTGDFSGRGRDNPVTAIIFIPLMILAIFVIWKAFYAVKVKEINRNLDNLIKSGDSDIYDENKIQDYISRNLEEEGGFTISRFKMKERYIAVSLDNELFKNLMNSQFEYKYGIYNNIINDLFNKLPIFNKVSCSAELLKFVKPKNDNWVYGEINSKVIASKSMDTLTVFNGGILTVPISISKYINLVISSDKSYWKVLYPKKWKIFNPVKYNPNRVFFTAYNILVDKPENNIENLLFKILDNLNKIIDINNCECSFLIHNSNLYILMHDTFLNLNEHASDEVNIQSELDRIQKSADYLKEIF